jgi:hypothetical protein
LVTNSALNDVLEVYLRDGTKTATWYVGLIDNSPTPTLAAADTPASHAGWSESTAYSESTRPAWTPGAAASQSMTNTTSVDFTINSTPTIYGFFLASVATKGATSGKFFGTAAFSGGAKGPLDTSTILKVTCTVPATAT